MFTPEFFIAAAICFALSYLLGSINSAVIVSRVYAKDDVRLYGSGSAGMTNILRNYGTLPAAFTAFGDFVKTLAAIMLSRYIFSRLGIDFDIGYAAGYGVMLGHMFPLYFGFRGGKAVITGLGIILCLNPLVFLILLVVCLPVIALTKYVSVGSVLGALMFPVLIYLFTSSNGDNALYDTIGAAIMTAIILYNHRSNIKRLLNGTENKFTKKK